jgi:hypothetical protein
MNITTTKSLFQLNAYERNEVHGIIIKKYGLNRGSQIIRLAERITSQRKFISAYSAVDRSVEWFRRERF